MRPNERRALVIAAIVFAGVSGITDSARAGGYDDLSAFIQHQTASGERFISDLQSAKTADQVVAALRGSARQQRQNCDELLAVLSRHPELKNLPELGLDRQALQLWAETHPNAQARRALLPTEALMMSDAMKRSATSLAQQDKNQQAVAVLAQYKGDPEVAAASNVLRSAMEESRRRLLKAFL